MASGNYPPIPTPSHFGTEGGMTTGDCVLTMGHCHMTTGGCPLTTGLCLMTTGGCLLTTRLCLMTTAGCLLTTRLCQSVNGARATWMLPSLLPKPIVWSANH